MKRLILIFLLLSFIKGLPQETYTRKDSLKGGLRSERTDYDILKYNLNIKIDVDQKHIVGYNDIQFKVVVKKTRKIQIDLYENMKVDSIVFNQKKVEFKREFNAVFIEIGNYLMRDFEGNIRFYYSGNPIIAKNAPWDGGFTFKKDSADKDFVGVACQGAGASLWFPCKDSQSDEPDFGATIKVAVPNGLMNVSNGKLIASEDLKNGFTRWDWEVKNPINAYDITINIGDYVHFGENYKGLDLDYYVLRENESKAKLQFEQVKPMMDCFQSKFGEYPFKEDGYKLVETSYLGMEHQSAVAYGNKYLNGYLGGDISGTGIGMTFDYIIIHESGHEWFGNSITSKDIADMWIHEAFTMYSESVFVECQFGKEKALKYLNGMQKNVQNDKPIIGPFGVNKEGSGDMYYKGALMINAIRSTIDNDQKWWEIMLQFANKYKHKITDSKSVIAFFNKESGKILTPIFEQYLNFSAIPKLDLKVTQKKLEYKWITNVSNFNMPIDIKLNGKIIRLNPTNEVQKSDFNVKKLKDVQVLTDNFFVNVVRN